MFTRMRSKLSPPSRLRHWTTHAVRVGMLCGILTLIHAIHAQTIAIGDRQALESSIRDRIRAIFGQEAKLGDAVEAGTWAVLNGDGERIGSVLQTAPASDSSIGFSGPTNLLVALDSDGKIRRMEVLTSGDTRDHVKLITGDPSFLASWNGQSLTDVRNQAVRPNVTGATLTSLAIVQGLQRRLGANMVASKFPDPLTLEDAKSFFADAQKLTPDESFPSLWHVWAEQGNRIGWLLRTSPTADDVVGYQGPSDTFIAVEFDGTIRGYRLGRSFDNEPYVGYVRNDRAFRALLQKYRLDQLSQLDVKREGIEGVSGATMTSMAMVQGLIRSAQGLEAARASESVSQDVWSRRLKQHLGTLIVVGLGAAMGVGRLRVSKWGKLIFQLVIIGYLGFWNGQVLSVAMFAGWAQSGIPWQNALGLCILSATAIALPITTKRNVYCSHLCPHGAVQQLIPRKWRLQRSLPGWLRSGIRWLRPLLVIWVLVVLAVPLGFSLVDIEPFDAYVWRAVAIPSLLVALAGIVYSIFVPMGYCQHGCVTGGLLQYLRRHAQSHRLGRADYFALSCLVGCFLAYVWHRF